MREGERQRQKHKEKERKALTWPGVKQVKGARTLRRVSDKYRVQRRVPPSLFMGEGGQGQCCSMDFGGELREVLFLTHRTHTVGQEPLAQLISLSSSWTCSGSLLGILHEREVARVLTHALPP